MRSISTVLATVCAITLITLPLLGCTSGTDRHKLLVVSIPPQKYMAEQIAGDRMEVKALLSSQSNPETYEPSMTDMATLEKCSAYLQMGHLPFENAITDKIMSTRPDLPVSNASEGISLISGTHGAQHVHSGHVHADDVDPHTWSSVANARIIAANTLRTLIQADPRGEEYYRDRYDKFILHLDSLDTELRRILGTSPHPFLIWHPSLSYFSRDYGLEQIPVSPDNKDLATSNLRRRIEEARSKGAATLLMQRDFDSRQAETLSRELDAKIIYINPLNENWERELLHTAGAIADKE